MLLWGRLPICMKAQNLIDAGLPVFLDGLDDRLRAAHCERAGLNVVVGGFVDAFRLHRINGKAVAVGHFTTLPGTVKVFSLGHEPLTLAGGRIVGSWSVSATCTMHSAAMLSLIMLPMGCASLRASR